MPLETILLSICSVAQVEGRKDIFELSYDNKMIKIHSPDVREVNDWFHFFVNSLHYAQVSFIGLIWHSIFNHCVEERFDRSSRRYGRISQY